MTNTSFRTIRPPTHPLPGVSMLVKKEVVVERRNKYKNHEHLKAFSALKGSSHLLSAHHNVGRASSRFHIREMRTLKPTERSRGLPQVMCASNWPECWCTDPGSLIPSQRLSPTHLIATAPQTARALQSASGALLCPPRKRHCTVFPSLSGLYCLYEPDSL